MITDEILKIHDELERKATVRPWSSIIRRRPGYGNLIFWSRRPGHELCIDNEHDARYMSFLRNVGPEMVIEIKKLKAKIDDLEEMIKVLSDNNPES